jgi:hypothetical protein
MFSQVAPQFFPIDAVTGLIAFPVEVKRVVFDIDARVSDYLGALEKTKDPSVALILIDPLPPSMIPTYALNERSLLHCPRNSQTEFSPSGPPWGTKKVSPISMSVWVLRVARSVLVSTSIHTNTETV